MQKFSVLMSVYIKESPDFFNDSLKSLANQTLRPSEVIIVQDGPLTSELHKVIKDWKQELNIVDVVLNINQGLGKALNIGLRHCSYELVARMDTDDVCHPDRFQNQLNAINNHKLDLVGSWVGEFDATPNDITSIRKVPCSLEEIKRASKFRNPINHPSVMYRKSVIEKHGSYEDVPYFEDYFLWLKLLHNGVVMKNLPQNLVFMRAGTYQLARRSGLNYLKKEFKFLRLSFKREYLPLSIYLLNIISRLPLRILPKSFIALIYKNLRKN